MFSSEDDEDVPLAQSGRPGLVDPGGTTGANQPYIDLNAGYSNQAPGYRNSNMNDDNEMECLEDEEEFTVVGENRANKRRRGEKGIEISNTSSYPALNQEQTNSDVRKVRVSGHSSAIDGPVEEEGEIRKSPNYPTNGTLRSKDSKNTIVITQADDKQSKISHDPIGIAKGLDAILDKDDIKDVRINRRRNCIAVELKQEASSKKQALLEIEQVGKWKVKIHESSQDQENFPTCSAVIGPLDLETDRTELLKSLKNAVPPVIDIVRLPMFTPQGKKDSLSLKLVFKGKELPDKIFIRYISYNVKPYNPPPLRCYRCQRPGHIASGCTQSVRCLLCGGGHDRRECISARIDHKCANCNQAHRASSRECPLNIQGKEIVSLMRRGISFAEARKTVIDGNNSNRITQTNPAARAITPQTSVASRKVTSHQVPVEVHHPPGSYAQAVTSENHVSSDFEGFNSYRDAALDRAAEERRLRLQQAIEERRETIKLVEEMLKKQEESFNKRMETMFTQVGVLLASVVALKKPHMAHQKLLLIAESQLGEEARQKIEENIRNQNTSSQPSGSSPECAAGGGKTGEQIENGSCTPYLRSQDQPQNKSKEQASKLSTAYRRKSGNKNKP